MLKDNFRKEIFYTLLFILSFNSNNYSQDSLVIFKFPSFKEITFSVRSTLTINSNEFSYNYKVKNYSTSQQEINNCFLRTYSLVSVVSSPVSWYGGYYNINIEKVSWFAIDSTKRIKQNEVKDMFSFLSSGLPIISDFHCRGFVSVPIVEEEPEVIIGGNIFENSVKKRTLAPKSIPNPFNAAAFALDLLSMGDEADSLDWISPNEDDDTWDILKSHLKSAFNNILIKNYKESSKYLERFLELVDEYYKSDKPKLSDEAYALFKYNGEYLYRFIITQFE